MGMNKVYQTVPEEWRLIFVGAGKRIRVKFQVGIKE